MKHKSILLVGVGNFGKHIARKFNELGHDVMAIDQDEERINDVIISKSRLAKKVSGRSDRWLGDYSQTELEDFFKLIA